MIADRSEQLKIIATGVKLLDRQDFKDYDKGVTSGLRV